MKDVAMVHTELADREAIRDCLFTYCRGVDRYDEDLVRSTFWPDAHDDHVQFSGNVDEFIQWSWPILNSMDQTQHSIGNMLIDIRADQAHVESHLHAYHRMRKPDGGRWDLFASARYIDLFERRNGEWRVLRRNVINEWFRKFSDSGEWEGDIFGKSFRLGSRNKQDLSYESVAALDS